MKENRKRDLLKFRAVRLLAKVRLKATTENRTNLWVVTDYLFRKISSFIRLKMVLFNPNFDYMKWRERSKDQAMDEFFVNRPTSSNEFLWRLADLTQIHTVLELGSNSGSRLRDMAIHFPEKYFVGVDIDLAAVNIGNEWAKLNQIGNFQLFHSDITSEKFYNQFSNQKFDLIFSWASLIYIHPTRIMKLLKFLLQSANKQIVIIEQHNSRLTKFPKYLGVRVRKEPTWVRNYEYLVDRIDTDKVKGLKVLPVPTEIWHPGGGWAHVVDISLSNLKSTSDK